MIYEEFKGAGNTEVHLDLRLSEKRVYPAIGITRSGTRCEELLLDEDSLRQVWLLRRMVSMISSDAMQASEAAEKVLERLRKTDSSAEFLGSPGKDHYPRPQASTPLPPYPRASHHVDTHLSRH